MSLCVELQKMHFLFIAAAFLPALRLALRPCPICSSTLIQLYAPPMYSWLSSVAIIGKRSEFLLPLPPIATSYRRCAQNVAAPSFNAPPMYSWLSSVAILGKCSELPAPWACIHVSPAHCSLVALAVGESHLMPSRLVQRTQVRSEYARRFISSPL